MKKTFRSILTLFLVLVMLFGVSAPTVAYALDSTSAESGNNSTNTSDGSTVGDTLDTGWCVITYDANELKVTLYPDVDSLKEIDKQQIKDLLQQVIDAAKTIVIDDLKDSIVNGQYGDVGDDDFTVNSVDDIWTIVIDRYIATLDPSISEAEDTYVEFFKAAFGDVTLIEGLIDYACDLLTIAVKTGMLELSELEAYTETQIRTQVDKMFKTEVQKRLSAYVEDYVNKYLAWILSDDLTVTSPDLPPEVLDFVDGKVSAYLNTLAQHYINGNLDANDTLDVVINDYIGNELTAAVEKYIAEYAAGTLADGDVKDFIAEEMDTLVRDNIEAYLQHRFHSGVRPAFYGEIEEKVLETIEAEAKDYAIQNGFAADDPRVADKALELYNDETFLRDNTTPANVSKVINAVLADYLAEYNGGTLDARYNDVISDMIDEVKTSSEYMTTLEAEVEKILNSGTAIKVFREILHDIHEDMSDPDATVAAEATQKYNTIVDEIEAEVASHTEFDLTAAPVSGDFRDEVFNYFLGIGYADFLAKLDEYVDLLINAYNTTVVELGEVDTEISIKDILNYLTEVKVNGEVVYGIFNEKDGAVVNTDAIIKLVKELPSFTDISKMTNDEMKLSYEVEVSTDFGKCDFVVTGVIGGGYEKIRTLARLLADHIDLYIDDDGAYVANVRMPELFHKAVLKACTTGAISDELKQKVFKAMSATVGELEVFYNNLDFADVIELLEAINFEGILDSQYIKKYVDLSGLTNEEIVAKVKEYERYFNKLKTYASKLVNKIPERFTDNSLMDLYEGNGVFGYEGTHTVNIEDTLTKISAKYGPLIAAFIDRETITASVDLSLSFQNIYHVQYEVNGEVVREGFLPAELEYSYIEFFANMTDVDGVEIVAWVDENGDLVTEMPARDVVLTAVLDKDFEVIAGADINAVYDGSAHTVSVAGSSATATYEYKWYKKGTEGDTLLTHTGASFDVVNVADSGEYYCVVTATEGHVTKTITSDVITVTIAKATISVSDVVWDYDSSDNFVYEIVNGVETVYTVAATVNGHNVTVTYASDAANGILNTASKAGNYVARIATVTGYDEANYELADGVIGAECAWVISPVTVDLSAVAWDGHNSFIYDGTAQAPVLLGAPAQVEVAYVYYSVAVDGTETVVSATADKGNYKVVATLSITAECEGNYVFADGATLSYEETYAIADSYSTVVVPAQPWLVGDYTYNENPQAPTVDLTAFVGADAVKSYKFYKLVSGVYEEVTSAVDAGDYKVVAVVSSLPEYVFGTDAEGNLINDQSFECEFTIAPAKISLGDIDFSGAYDKELTYNAKEQHPTLTIPSDYTDILGVDVYNGTGVNVGSYNTSVTLKPISSNYVIDGSASVALEWSITPASLIDLAGIYFTVDGLGTKYYVGNDGKWTIAIEYDGNVHTLSALFDNSDLDGMFGIAIADNEQLPTILYIKDYVINFVATVADEYKGNFTAETYAVTVNFTVKEKVVNYHETTDSDGDTLIGVSSDKGIKADRELVAKDAISDDRITNLVATKKLNVLAAFDIYFQLIDNGGETEESDTFTVKMQISDVSSLMASGFTFKVVYIDENGDIAEEIQISDADITVEGGKYYVTFETTHFSTYAFIYELQAIDVEGENVVSITDNEFDYDPAVTVDIRNYINILAKYQGILDVTYLGDVEKNNADNYTVNIKLSIKAGYTDKYYFVGTDSKEFTWVINRKTADLPTFALDNNEFLYDGTVKSVALNAYDTSIFTLTLESGELSATNAGTYPLVYKLTVNDNYYVANAPAKVELSWSIKQKTVSLPTFALDNVEFVYDGTVKSVALNAYDTSIFTLTLESGELSATNAGTYPLVYKLSVNDNYYVADKPSTVELSWSIKQKTVDLPTFALDNEEFVYDGTVKSVALNAYDTSIFTLTLESGELSATNAGTYPLVYKLSVNDNYYVADKPAKVELSWSIKQKTVSLPTFALDNVEFVYDGTVKSVALNAYDTSIFTLTLESGELSATDVGTYPLVYNLSVNDNYYVANKPAKVELSWSIKQKTVSLPTFALDNSVLTYTGEELSVNLADNFDANVFTLTLVDGSVLKATNVGEYTVKYEIAVNDNYSVDGVEQYVELKWNIEKLVVDLSDVTWEENTADKFTYDGTEKKLLLALPADFPYHLITVNYEYTGDGIESTELEDGTVVYSLPVNAGSYVAKLLPFTYDESNIDIIAPDAPDVPWEIFKADVDMSGITFEDYSVAFDGKTHKIEISGTLPEFVEVTYSATDLYFIGAHTVTASFKVNDPNYNDNIEPMTATLTITVVYQGTHGYYDSEGLVVGVESTLVPADHEFKVNDNSILYDFVELEDGTLAKVLAAYDIYFAKAGTYQPLYDDFAVSIRVPNGYAEKTLIIVYIAEDGTTQQFESEVVDGYVKFSAEHFSTYAVVTPDFETAADEDEFPWWLVILLLVIIIILLAVIIVLIITKKKASAEAEVVISEELPEVEPEGEPEAEEESVVEEPVVEEPAVEEPVVEEPVVEEPVVEEPVIEEPVVEEPVVEEPVVEEPVVEEPVVTEPIVPVVVSGDEDGVSSAIVDGEVVYVRYRSSFESRLIQSETEIQDYYTYLKNVLLGYKGVKSRTSWNFESFNKGRVQCAKLNIKGRALLVYLNLDPKAYSESKYHFTDVSDKPKLDKVPMLLKVKSDRGLKYAEELIEEMMKNLEIPAIDRPNEDYHMPYETTEALAKRGLVKVILPAGMTLDENSNIVKVNVGELLEGFESKEKTDADEPVVETPVVEEPVVEEPVVEEPVVEEPVVEEPVVEEPVVEEPVVEEPVVEEPVVEEPVVEEPVVEEPVVEEPIHVDATHADELLTDEEAEAKIEVIHTGASKRTGKLVEINLDVICENFEDGDTVDIDSLKAKKLISKNAGRVKVLARGTMTRNGLTVIASKFSIQAVKMITLAGGVAEIED